MSVRTLLRLAVLTLTLLLSFAVLSSHHDEGSPTDACYSEVASAPAAEDAASIISAAGCGLLVACCLLALLVLRRTWRSTLVVAAVQSEPPTPTLSAIGSILRIPQRPSLVALSISRT